MQVLRARRLPRVNPTWLSTRRLSFGSFCTVLLGAVLLIFPSTCIAGGGLAQEIRALQDFVQANPGALSANQFNILNQLINNARVIAIDSQVSGATLDKSLEAVRLFLRQELEESEPDNQMFFDQALKRLEDLRILLVEEALGPLDFDLLEPSPFPEVPDSCTVEILQIVRGRPGRIVNGRFTLQAGSILDLEALALPSGGMTDWGVDPSPANFDSGGFSTHHCDDCSAGRLRFFAPPGEKGRTSYLVSGHYTSPAGLECSDQLMVTVR